MLKLINYQPFTVKKGPILSGNQESVSVPDYWDPQARDKSGKEVAVHLVTLNPNNPRQQKENKNISDHFYQTAGNQRIQHIQRVQNPSLFKQYLMKKQSLDEKIGSNEKFLFHGTRGDKVREINKTGLNRSYAGNAHGAVYGRGVYFALMSVGYAQTLVLTGQRYIMVVPPRKGGNDSYDSVVNNVANPTIFVLFYDNQYYPEYLITFV
ncbi:protein mono-ADP-ribosyltransferase PARP15-like [Dendronephthya gigantea]|uniref:protein mono-ADP-ribosyltransferase PARP15-like n=1 Tax=Dendronephthya gigantea TaxID=151771 RepID=UPI00106D8D9F|nr:protein mono-ADP-ribosyltransferase PARP15-like [Dendronephthya gigantea]